MTDTIHEPRGIQMKLVFSDDERGTIDQHQTNCVTKLLGICHHRVHILIPYISHTLYLIKST